ncbi:MAG: hypothetical protein OEV28_00705 [Nitrospirota bacterium]|nr:hypothetical protein [Nitrospirota bacterium]
MRQLAALVLAIQFLIAGGICYAQEKTDETVGQKVDSSLDAAKKKLHEWEENLKEMEAKGKKLGKKTREEFRELKAQFIEQKDNAVAKLKDLNERKGEIGQEVGDQFKEAYQKAGETFDKIKGLFGTKSENSSQQ